MTKEYNNSLYRQFAADEAIVNADPELDEGEKGRLVTELVNQLWEDEAEAGIVWNPLFSFEATTGGDGSVEFTVPKNKPEGDG